MRHWVATVEDTYYCLGSVMGPHPYPWMVREFHRVIGTETAQQCAELLADGGGRPDVVVACVGGGSNAAGIFAGFASQGALARHDDPAKASRPFDLDRNGIVVSEGGCIYVLERYDDARRRGAKIYGELVGYAMNSDASDFVLPNPSQQARCMEMALKRARLNAADIDLVSTHATATDSGDIQECAALRRVFGGSPRTLFNNSKSFIGHTMGAAGALELAGNLPAFGDGVCHATINVDELDPQCALDGLVANEPRETSRVDVILNNSFGMLGINSVVIVKRV